MKIKFPTPYSVLMLVIILGAVLTFVLPSGKYDTLSYNEETKAFTITTADKTYSIPATQQILKDKGITIALEKFTQGKIKKPISIPNTYKRGEPSPQGLDKVLFAPIKGIYESIDIIFFVLVLGGFIGVFNSSGTLNEGVGYLAYRLKGREGILIIIVTSLIALGGTSFGLAEETLAFYPMLVPVFMAARYDLMVPLAVIYIGSAVGTMVSLINPFSVIIASDAVGVDWTSGMGLRAVALLVMLVVSIIYIIRYAEKVKKNPELSVAYGVKLPKSLEGEAVEITTLKASSKVLLLVFGISFLVMIIGVSQLGWWFQEMTAVFLVSSVLIAILQRSGEYQFIDNFINGARDLLGVAFIIGIARGVTFILSDGQVSDTILYYSSEMVQGMSPMVFLPVLACVFAVLTLFIASSSGMATVTMPITGALAKVVGIEGTSVVNAYMIGMGLMSFLAPTGLILPSLAMVGLNYKHWVKFIKNLLLILSGIAVLFLWADYFMS